MLWLQKSSLQYYLRGNIFIVYRITLLVKYTIFDFGFSNFEHDVLRVNEYLSSHIVNMYEMFSDVHYSLVGFVIAEV
jgi:hypothetical protein